MTKRKFFIISGLFLIFSLTKISAAAPVEYQNYDLDMLLHEITQAGEPIINDDYIIFTADTNYRFVGIAFDFEDYQIIHPFQIFI